MLFLLGICCPKESADVFDWETHKEVVLQKQPGKWVKKKKNLQKLKTSDWPLNYLAVSLECNAS